MFSEMKNFLAPSETDFLIHFAIEHGLEKSETTDPETESKMEFCDDDHDFRLSIDEVSCEQSDVYKFFVENRHKFAFR